MANIAYIICSKPEINHAGTRISALNIFELLQREGHNPFILYNPPHMNVESKPQLDGIVEKAVQEYGVKPPDVVYFQQVYGANAIQAAGQFAAQDIKTILGIYDVVEPEMAEACSATIVPSEYLKSRYPSHLQDRIHVVHDGIEQPHIYKERYSQHFATNRQPIKAVIITADRLERLPVLEECPKYVSITVFGVYDQRQNPGVQDFQNFYAIPWFPTVFERLPSFDLGLIPVELNDDGSQFCSRSSKSANRLTQLMGAGLPVIASPVPAYQDIVTNGINGYIARSQQEWLAYLKELRDGSRRKRMGKAARNRVINSFSQEIQAALVSDVINKLSNVETV